MVVVRLKLANGVSLAAILELLAEQLIAHKRTGVHSVAACACRFAVADA